MPTRKAIPGKVTWWRKSYPVPGDGGTRYILGWGGAVRPPNTLTLFKTKIADFPTLFKTEFRFLIPCLRHLTRNHTLCKTIINKNFAVVYFVEHTQRLFIVQEKIHCLRQKLIKSMPWLRQKMIKSKPCLRQKSRKTYPGSPHVPIKPL